MRLGIICDCGLGMTKIDEHFIGEGEYGEVFEETWLCRGEDVDDYFDPGCSKEVTAYSIRGW